MPDPLFHRAELRSFLIGQEQALDQEISSLQEQQVLNSSPKDLEDYFVEKYLIEPIEINESEIHADHGDAQVDVSHRSEYAFFNRSGPAYVTGTKITFYVPFSGEPQLFKYRPSTSRLNSPQADIRNNELVFTYERTTQDAPKIKNEFERDLSNVKYNLDEIAKDTRNFNSTLRQKPPQFIRERREKLLRDREIAENLGFPLKRRSGMPTTYVTPEVKRRIVPKLPKVSTKSYMPEPTLDMEEYEHILSVVSNMVLVMERSPRAFKDIGEEALRQHFLVQLNAQYEGQATGETFNYSGKTDSLVKSHGRGHWKREIIGAGKVEE